MKFARLWLVMLLVLILSAVLLIFFQPWATKSKSGPAAQSANDIAAVTGDTTSTEVWFAPNIGSVDMLDLFTKPEQWASARSKIDVFEFYGGHVGTAGWSCAARPEETKCGPNHLENFVEVDAFTKLAEWGIDIAIESFFAGPVMSIDPIECTPSDRIFRFSLEGSVNIIRGVEENGGTVRYLAMDEPVRQWYPTRYHLETGKVDPRPCLVDSLDKLADEVAAYHHQMTEWYPAIPIGQIELYPEVGVAQLKEWILALKARGVALPFLRLDVHGLRVEQYAQFGMEMNLADDLAELDSFLEAEGIAFGIIYTDLQWNSQIWEEGTYSDRIYYDATMDWVKTVRAAEVIPDQSVFQSWVIPYYDTGFGPKQRQINLPEDDPAIYSHTRLINEALKVILSDSSNPVVIPESRN